MGNSITVENMFSLVRTIQQEANLPSDVTSNDLRAYFQSKKIHPMKAYPEFYCDKFPMAAITYEWRTSFSQLSEYLNSESMEECDLTLGLQKLSKAEPLPKDMRILMVWIDILFLDQNNKDMRKELKKATPPASPNGSSGERYRLRRRGD